MTSHMITMKLLLESKNCTDWSNYQKMLAFFDKGK